MLTSVESVDDSLVSTLFEQTFGIGAAELWWAPGRVNLVGEHTDYNGGFVLPIAIPMGTVAAIGRRDDDRIGLVSTNDGVLHEFALADVQPGAELDWCAYSAGVGWAAARLGLMVPGVNIAVATNVPQGAGLSSSAALSCASARGWASIAGWTLSEQTLAALGRDAENEIAGAPTGVMDQLASVCGRAGQAMMIDTRDSSVQHIALPLEPNALSLLVIDSHAPHRLVDGEYADRRTACEEAARILGVRELCEIDLATLLHDHPGSRRPLSDVLFRRARHVISDSARVTQVAEIVRSNSDLRRIGLILNDSHASMRDDFEITVAETDLLQQAAVDAGAHGARQTGGGFGGCVVALVDTDEAAHVADRCAAAAAAAGQRTPTSYIVDAVDGAHRLR